MKKLLLVNFAPLNKLGITFCFTFLILHSAFSQSPNWLWAKAMGGKSSDYGNSIAVDVSGTVYTTGTFSGTVDFDPGAGAFYLIAPGIYSPMFISKLDASGNFVWAKAIGGTNSVYSVSIALDASGNVYTTGHFNGTADFDPGAGVFNLTSAVIADIFVSKLDSSGNFVWAKKMGGAQYDAALSIAIDDVGNVYTTGFSQGGDFNPDTSVTFNLTSAGSWDIFISKLDSSGNFIWAKAMGGTGDDYGYAIALDDSGNVYTTGSFAGTADFDPGAGVFNLWGPTISNNFISKLDSSGNFVWAKARSGIASGCVGHSIGIDGSGNVYTTGTFGGTIDFDPGASVFNLTAVGTVADIFVSKLDSGGNFIWAKGMGSASSDDGHSIAIDVSGNVYTTGYFANTIDFDPGVNTFNLIAASSLDIFILKLDSAGNFAWAKAVGGTGNDYGYSIALGASGNVYVAGYFQSLSIPFGSITLTNDTTSTTPDIFIAKLDTTFITGNNEIESLGKEILLYPNPFSNSIAISFVLSKSQNVSLKIFDLNGRLITTLTDKFLEPGEHKIVWNPEKVDAGIYFLQFHTAENLQMKKLITTK